MIKEIDIKDIYVFFLDDIIFFMKKQKNLSFLSYFVMKIFYFLRKHDIIIKSINMKNTIKKLEVSYNVCVGSFFLFLHHAGGLAIKTFNSFKEK